MTKIFVANLLQNCDGSETKIRHNLCFRHKIVTEFCHKSVRNFMTEIISVTNFVTKIFVTNLSQNCDGSKTKIHHNLCFRHKIVSEFNQKSIAKFAMKIIFVTKFVTEMIFVTKIVTEHGFHHKICNGFVTKCCHYFVTEMTSITNFVTTNGFRH